MAKKSGYDLSRHWFNFAFEKEEAKVVHTAIYMWILELNNRLGWKQEFGLPTQDTMEGLSIGNKMTYLSAIKDLTEWKFIEIVKESKNQYQSMIIKLCHSDNATARGTALDTALQRHHTQHSNSTSDGIGDSIAPIDKPRNQETKKPQTKKPSSPPKVGDPLTKDFVDRYEKFLLTNANVGENVTVAGRAALKKIIAYLRGQVKNKHGDAPDVEAKTVEAWEYVLNHFQKWDAFQQKNLNLEQINKNLVNIISTIRNSKPNGKHIDPEQLAAEAMQIYDAKRNG